jgi:hypothetical protein
MLALVITCAWVAACVVALATYLAWGVRPAVAAYRLGRTIGRKQAARKGQEAPGEPGAS